MIDGAKFSRHASTAGCRRGASQGTARRQQVLGKSGAGSRRRRLGHRRATSSRDRRDVPLEEHAEHGFDVLLAAFVPKPVELEPAPQVLGRVIRYEFEELRADFEPCEVALELVLLAAAAKF